MVELPPIAQLDLHESPEIEGIRNLLWRNMSDSHLLCMLDGRFVIEIVQCHVDALGRTS
jgi:hypothetical protein